MYGALCLAITALTRRALWREDQDIDNKLSNAKEEADKAERDLQNTMNKVRGIRSWRSFYGAILTCFNTCAI